jgi:hypothetical protein
VRHITHSAGLPQHPYSVIQEIQGQIALTLFNASAANNTTAGQWLYCQGVANVNFATAALVGQ